MAIDDDKCTTYKQTGNHRKHTLYAYKRLTQGLGTRANWNGVSVLLTLPLRG